MNIDELFNKSNFTPVAPETGRILISEPFMQDPNFARSVVLMVDHNTDGTVGLVLNQKSELAVSDVLVEHQSINAPLYIGGPVGNNQLFYLHTLGPELIPGAIPVLDNLYFGGDFDQLVFYMNNGMLKSSEIRFFAGYSGWAPNQLEDELKDRAWIVTTFSADLALKDSENFWKEMMVKLGEKFAVMSQFPQNPALN